MAAGRGRPLAGLSAAVLRSADRAGGLAAELAARGAVPVLCPLIDFELPEDTGPLDAMLRGLAAGDYAWLALTSVTTVRALRQRAEALGTGWPATGGARVAAVGEATREAAEAEGLAVELVPVAEATAAGLVRAWPRPPGGAPGTAPDDARRVALPAADLASPVLRRGLLEAGWVPEPVVAYRTVDAPADPGRRLAAPCGADAGDGGAAGGGRHRVLGPAGLAAELAAGRLDAVLLTSPSIARALHRLGAAPRPGTAVVAIGEPTAAEATGLGWEVAATATEASPAGLCDAWERALAEKTTHPDTPRSRP